MATFSVNQVRHLYVANSVGTVNEAANLGTTEVGGVNGKYFYFLHKGAGGVTRSDKVDVDKILSVTAKSASNFKRSLKRVKVELDSTIDTDGLIVGADYILRVDFRQYVGMSDEDRYFKYGAVHIFNSTTASDFYKQMAISLAKNFSREYGKLLKFEITLDGTDVEVTASTKVGDLTGTATALYLTEAPQEWKRGVLSQVPVFFDVYSASVFYQGSEIEWGIVTDVTSNTLALGNGKKIADLEYFCMGDRGDLYRNIGWPHVIETQYLVDPSQEYDVLDIHFYFVDGGEGAQKSEKTITVVCPTGGDMADLVDDINTKTGLSVTLD